MASDYNFISEVTPLNQNMRIKVRIIRLWKEPTFKNANEYNLIDMVFMDEKGARIQATIKNKLIKQFKDTVSEGICCYVSDFGVGDNKSKYKKIANHPYKICFFYTTSVKICSDENVAIPLYGFQFSSFEQIKSNCLDDDFLIDTFGQVISASSLQEVEKNGKLSKIITMELNDIEGKRLKCTLWEKYAEEAAKFFSEMSNEPVILAIQFAQIKEWNGEKSISNVLFCTRVVYNGDSDEIQELRKSLAISNASSSITKSNQFSQNSVSPSDEFLHLHKKKTVDEILQVNIPMTCTTLATIMALQLEHGWYYIGCSKCTRKVKEIRKDGIDSGSHSGSRSKSSMFYCEKCNKELEPERVSPRFKLHVRVIDENGSASFVLFDREVRTILKMSANYLIYKLSKMINHSYPEELNILVGKTCIFKVEISEFNLQQDWQVFTATKITDKEELIQLYQTEYFQEEDDGNSKNNTGEKEIISVMGDTEQLSEVTTTNLNEITGDDAGLQLSSTKKKMKVETD